MKRGRLYLAILLFISIVLQVALRDIFTYIHFEVFIIFTVILSFKKTYYESMIWSFVAGFIQDVFSGAPGMGVYAFIAIIICFLINQLKDILILKNTGSLISFVFIASLIELIMSKLIFTYLFGIRSGFHGSILIKIILPAALNCLVALPIYVIFNKIEKISRRKIWTSH